MNKFLYQRYLCSRIYICIALLPLTVMATKVNAQTRQKPNIILILADDVGYKSLTCNGGNLYATPNINKLAKDGMRFTECYASATCSPSRFMLLTGKYNFRNYTEWGNMRPSEHTIGNMLKDAGYKTAYYGKWQLNGGDASVHAFGFDNYCIWNVFDKDADEKGRKYKSPELYTNGKFISDSLVQNKYSEDILADSILDFMKNNKSKPFFIYYSMLLAHAPFQPTPDDPDYADWESANKSDTQYFKSMMKYMDKNVAKIINRVKSLGIEDNTVILFAGDNGTPNEISDYREGNKLIEGGKGSTKGAGIHVPFIAYWPGKITPGAVNKDLIGFVDFLPTLAGIANTPLPDYGPLDGISFYPRLINQAGTPRDWLFCDYNPLSGEGTFKRWAQTKQYKLYDTSGKKTTRLFYDIINDPNERHPIPDSLLTEQQTAIRRKLLNAIKMYVAEGTAILETPKVSSVTDSSATVLNSIKVNGGSTITASGVVWGKKHAPVLKPANHTSENLSAGEFYSSIKGLEANTMYYARSYAINAADTAYSEEISFKTLPQEPISLRAEQISNTSFVAKWKNTDDAGSYRVDVSTFPSFSFSSPDSSVENFDNGLNPAPEWAFSESGLVLENNKFGKSAPSLRFIDERGTITTPAFSSPVTQLSFWIKGLKQDSGSLLLEGFDGYIWKPIEMITDIPVNGKIKVYNKNSSPALTGNFIKFRFNHSDLSGSLYFDDIEIRYDSISPSFVAGYNNLNIIKDSLLVKGLHKHTKYYYRVRAVNGGIASVNSNTISVTTGNLQLDTPVCKNPTNILKNAFTANWNKLNGATEYKIDVSTSPTFSLSKPVSVIEAFDKGLTPPAGWEFSPDLRLDTAIFGKASPSLRLFKSNQKIITKTFPFPINRLSFFIKNFNANTGSLLIEGYNGKAWHVIDNITSFSKPKETKIYDSTSSPVLKTKYIQFRFTFTKAEGSIDIDDIRLNYNSITPSFVEGYHDSSVTNTSLKVTELKMNTTYYYRVRGASFKLDDTSAYSNIIEVITCANLAPAGGVITNINAPGDGAEAISLNNAGDTLTYKWAGTGGSIPSNQSINNLSAGEKQLSITSGAGCFTEIKPYEESTMANIFPNPSATAFTLLVQTGDKESISVSVSDLRGKTVYQSENINNGKYVFGRNFAPGIYFAHIVQGSIKKTIKIIKSK